MTDKDPMHRNEAIEGLRRALRLQLRSPLSYTLAAGTMTGLTLQPFAAELWEFATRDLDDARRLTEKLVSLGGTPDPDVAPLRLGDPERTLEQLLETEAEALEALSDVIQHTGQEAEGEALEHLLEHMIMRKQEQLDFVLRALGRH